jgi:hypothetical protein
LFNAIDKIRNRPGVAFLPGTQLFTELFDVRYQQHPVWQLFAEPRECGAVESVDLLDGRSQAVFLAVIRLSEK